jgi:hypothetical protein
MWQTKKTNQIICKNICKKDKTNMVNNGYNHFSLMNNMNNYRNKMSKN